MIEELLLGCVLRIIVAVSEYGSVDRKAMFADLCPSKWHLGPITYQAFKNQKISNTKRSPASTLRPCARRGECISYHGGHAAQTNYYICVGKIWKVYAGFYSHRFHGRKTFQDRGASLGYSEIPHVNMCLARPKFRDAVNLHVPQRKTAS